MKHVPLLAMLAAVALLGWYTWEREAAPPPAPLTPANTLQQPMAMPGAQPGGWGVVLPREPDGHFYADVTVAGAPARMLIDTGASVVALSGRDAEALGITWSPEEVIPVAQGAGGAVSGVRVTLGSVQLGDLEVRDVEAVVVPDLPISLLGQSFLKRVGRVEMTGNEMVLGG